MRSFLLSDNLDTLLGMRLAGVEGKMVKDKDEVVTEISRCIDHAEIGIVMITVGVLKMAEVEVMELKMKCKETLIVEIPTPKDQHAPDFITKYIRDSIGVKF